MTNHPVVSQAEWLAARRELLAKEKEFTHLRDQLSQQRRDLPWERVEKEYVFDGPNGKETLADLFDGKGQLVVYHFMFGPDWEEGCPSCSFWADNYSGIPAHLAHRDVAHVTISRAPLAKLEGWKQRMGWDFKWVSSYGNDFNFDYHVSFTPQQIESGAAMYNYQTIQEGGESPGISVFYKDDDGAIYHTYSTYARGLDMLNVAYHYLDLVPKGRDEENLPWPMAWLHYHDSYED
ncbi:MAG: thioredoxin family protein [Caldilineaceae bacterium]